MAEESKPKRRITKKVETVREKADKAIEQSKQQKPRQLQTTKRRATAPFRATGRGLRKAGKFKPFRILGYIVVPPYFRNSYKELKQVTWPNFRVSIRLTFAVFAFAFVFGVLIAFTDYGLDKVFKQVLLK